MTPIDTHMIHSLESRGYIVIPPGVRGAAIGAIQKRVAEHFGAPVSEMASRSRLAASVRARHVAIYLARELAAGSLTEIGNAFGGRDHRGVLYAIQTVTALMATDQRLADSISILRHELREAAGKPS